MIAPNVSTSNNPNIDDVAVGYCVDVVAAEQLIDEMLSDAGEGLLALDIETAPEQLVVDRLKALSIESAHIAGKLKALKKTRAVPAKIATAKCKAKFIAAQIGYSASAALDPRRGRVRLVQLYGGGRRVAVIDTFRAGEGVLRRLDGANVVMHNAAFDLSFMESLAVEFGEVHDTMQAARLTLGERAMSLEAAVESHLGIKLDKSQQTSDWTAAHLSERQVRYAAQDTVILWHLARRILPALGRQTAAYEIQVAAVPAAMRMKMRGFKLDVDMHAELMDKLARERVVACESYLRACVDAGRDDLAIAVPETPQQKAALLQALLTSDELASWRRTPRSGALSTKRSELRRAAHYPPVAELVKLSSIDKLTTAFGPTLVALVSPITGRLHADYKVAATASGRASCARPNLQQAPRDPLFRALFRPEAGNVLVVADYSSMELRAAAHISGDSAMTEAFAKGLDLHRITAGRMAGKQSEDVTADERRAAKAVNFGACYGLGASGLVKSAWDGYGVVIDRHEAAKWLGAFEVAYPQFARWRRDHAQLCVGRRMIVIGKDAARGIGRVYPFSRLPPGASAYTRSCNLPVQGSCADTSMLALAGIDRALFDEGIEGGPVAWLHDEIVLEVSVEDAPRAAELLAQEMISAFKQIFPGAPVHGLVDPHIGLNWSEAKK
jgi:DNA polymerase-1